MRNWLLHLALKGGITVESWEMRGGKWVRMVAIIGGKEGTRFLIDWQSADKSWRPSVRANIPQ